MKDKELAFSKLAHLEFLLADSEYSFGLRDDEDFYKFITIVELKDRDGADIMVRALEVRNWKSACAVLQMEIDRVERGE